MEMQTADGRNIKLKDTSRQNEMIVKETHDLKVDKSEIMVTEEQSEEDAEKVIWKFPLLDDTTDVNIEMPAGARIIAIMTQRDAPYLWAIVNPKNKMEVRRFVTTGTGTPEKASFFDNSIYVGSYQVERGRYVFHVFEDVMVRDFKR